MRKRSMHLERSFLHDSERGIRRKRPRERFINSSSLRLVMLIMNALGNLIAQQGKMTHVVIPKLAVLIQAPIVHPSVKKIPTHTSDYFRSQN
jgi:hypothetical protein